MRILFKLLKAKWKLSLFTHLYVLPNLRDIVSSVELKR